MKKALLITLAVVILLASLVGDYYIIKAVARRLQPAPEIAVETIPAKPPELPHSFGGETGEIPEEPEPDEPEPVEPEDPAEPVVGLTMTVQNSTGEMKIDRPLLDLQRSMGDAGTWTIFVYLCGTDLESDDYGGMASFDLEEMCQAASSDSVRFVVQTGGAYYWYDDRISPFRTQRFVVEDGELSRVYSGEWSGMGRTETLADFLTWGVEEYPAEHMGVILWNHGGGSISGVCFDELDEYDSLTLRELDAALLSVYGSMTDRFTFIGFDACLMSTVETANILASYADYMIASQESEPGSGWDYRAIGDYLADHPRADGEELGRVICDSFYASCEEMNDTATATLAVVDLRRMDTLLQRFNSFADSMYTAGEDPAALSAMVRGIVAADNFGGNNKVDGYTNMVDLGGLISACADWTEGAVEALEALSDAVVYQVTGSDHKNASGLAVYYPLSVQGSQELSVFGSVCVRPY